MPPPLYCVTDATVPAITTELLAAACAARGVAYVPVEVERFDPCEETWLRAGDMLFRPAVSYAAVRVEQALFTESAATFYASGEALCFDGAAAPLLFARRGLPIPRTVTLLRNDRAQQRRAVELLGGLPLVVKVPGGEGGVGVMLVESWASLVSVLDHLFAAGRTPQLMAYVADAVHWRVVVVGSRAVAAYRNHPYPGDFRSGPSSDPADYEVPSPSPLTELAVAATRAIRREFAGIDILAHASGRLYLLEANFPCYFPQAQVVGGIDVAGAMLGHLLEKSGRLVAI
ncbi:ATP-grasp domain-containing protein [Nannocystis pusilla]|uniref:ATP-grasp domain-containing protein n=1 Tax=Nannocystis pusilla TaxID=889268 RepID=UPI003DA5CF1B